MFKFYSVFILLILFSSCTGKSEEERPKNPFQKEVHKPLVVEDENGNYTEWYTGHEQIKIKGRKDEKDRRNGIWKMYSKEGVELSISEYENGSREGISIVKRPSGLLHYMGRYKNDKPQGNGSFMMKKEN